MDQKERKQTKHPVVFSMANNMCVWSSAGVVKPTRCMNAYDCLGCSFDQHVLENFEEQRKASGATDKRPARMVLMTRKGKCRHMLSGRIPYGQCSYAYECEKCAFDQMIQDTSYQPNLRRPTIDKVTGFDVARDHYYHHGHSWARVEYGGRVRVGLDDFALRLFGPQDEIRIPSLGSRVTQSSPAVVLKRSSNEAETLCPMDGEVVAVNHEIFKDARTANGAPYAEGWLMVIQPKNLRKNLKNLFFDSEALGWMDDEAVRLGALLGPGAQYAEMASGGEAISDIYGSVPEIGWDRLVQEFLR